MALSAALVLSGLPREHFLEDTHYVFNQGEVLLKSPTKASLEVTDTTSTKDNGATSSSSQEQPETVKYILNIIADLDKIFKEPQEKNTLSPIPEAEENKDKEDNEDKNMQIMHEKRDILNLAENISTGWSFQFAVTSYGSLENFENDFQLFGINEAEAFPRHVLVNCNVDDCSFLEPAFF